MYDSSVTLVVDARNRQSYKNGLCVAMQYLKNGSEIVILQCFSVICYCAASTDCECVVAQAVHVSLDEGVCQVNHLVVCAGEESSG